jgi:hypothetical protein
MARLEVSDIGRSIKGRIRAVEEQLKDHKALSDELKHLKGCAESAGRWSAFSRRRQAPSPAQVTQRTTAPAPKNTSPGTTTDAHAPRGENKEADPRVARGRAQDRVGDRK